jgi:hypothetical protein
MAGGTFAAAWRQGFRRFWLSHNKFKEICHLGPRAWGLYDRTRTLIEIDPKTISARQFHAAEYSPAAAISRMVSFMPWRTTSKLCFESFVFVLQFPNEF